MKEAMKSREYEGEGDCEEERKKVGETVKSRE